jgi:integrase
MRVPKKCHHKASGQAYVTDPRTGQEVYLGADDTPESDRAYARWVEEYVASQEGRLGHLAGRKSLTVYELTDAYWKHAQDYYRKDGVPTAQTEAIARIIRELLPLYGETRAAKFSPLAARAIRARFVQKKLARSTINRYHAILCSMWKWAASHELVPVETYQALRTIEWLKSGRSAARDTQPIKPVPRAQVEAVIQVLKPKYAAMLKIHLLTGMRAGELVKMKKSEISKVETVDSHQIFILFLYQPASHKTQHHGHAKTVWLGPEAQEILRPWMDRADSYLWTPQCGWRRRSKQPLRVKSYRSAIERACQRLKLPVFCPLQVRHLALTEIRAALGLEAAQAAGGHQHVAMTEIYAEKSQALAQKVALTRRLHS